MTNTTEIVWAETELVDDDAVFFAPVSSDLIDSLLGEYNATRATIERIGAILASEDYKGVMHYYLDGNANSDRGRSHLSNSADQLFQVTGAVAALNAAYWSKTLAQTDVLDCMPQKRRDEWNKSIMEMTTPGYTEDAVRPTIQNLLNMRSQFLAERVDGIFRGLSGEHVTNAPEAFGKRMIIAGVIDSYGTSSNKVTGLINDLRCVVAKFMGRDEPKWYASSRLIDTLRGNWGQWVVIDGGAIQIRLYKKGTAHMLIHPDMAWRLNAVLANLYPLAIPAQFRQRPPKRAKEVTLMNRPLPFAVLEILSEAIPRHGSVTSIGLGYRLKESNKTAWTEAAAVLECLGGMRDAHGSYCFDYDVRNVLDDIITSGCIPDQKSHQFYSTQPALAAIAAELATEDDPGEGLDAPTYLEPSAGTAGLADFLPKSRTTCVEVSRLRATMLKAKGYTTHEADFLVWAQEQSTRWNSVLMNPPFSSGRWLAHTTAAAQLLKPNGRLVSILPTSAKSTLNELPGMDELQWHGPYENQFQHTGQSVVILVARKRAHATPNSVSHEKQTVCA